MNEDIYQVLLHVHSVGRWVLLVLLLIAIFNSLVAGQRPFIRTDARTGLILTIVADLMLVIGGVLWYFGEWGYNQIRTRGMSAVMKDGVARFFVMEHLLLMLIAIILIHIGKVQGRKAISDRSKHNRTMWYYLIALILILISVPWPFRQNFLDRGWY